MEPNNDSAAENLFAEIDKIKIIKYLNILNAKGNESYRDTFYKLVDTIHNIGMDCWITDQITFGMNKKWRGNFAVIKPSKINPLAFKIHLDF